MRPNRLTRRDPWLLSLVGVLILAACQGTSDAGDTAGTTTTAVSTGELPLEEIVAGLPPADTKRTMESVPPPALESFTFEDWADALASGDPESVNAALSELLLSGGSGGATSSGQGLRRAALRTAVFRTVLAEEEIYNKTMTWEGENDKFAGAVEGTGEVTYDPETSRETTNFTVTGEGTLTASGEPIAIDIEAVMTQDLCWGENGDRTGEAHVTASHTDNSGEHRETRFARATFALDSPPMPVSWGKTVDGHTVVASGMSPGVWGPEGSFTYSTSGDTMTYVFDNGFQLETTGTDRAALERLAEEALDSDNFDSEIAAAWPVDRTEGPGSPEYCLGLVVEPSSAVLEPDGETLGLTVRVVDWRGEPVPGAGIRIGRVELGAITGPTAGSTDHLGEFGTLYTSDLPGQEDLFIEASYSWFRVDTMGVIRIGEFWTFTMTTDVEDVTFLWDGLFTVGGGLIEGSGIGTVLGTGRCEITGSGTNYTGPLIDVTGTFDFDLAGTVSGDDGAQFFELLIDSDEADLEFSYEDPMCGAFVDIARDFLSQVPTFPEFAPNVVVQVSDGFGIADLAFDPYVYEIEVQRADE